MMPRIEISEATFQKLQELAEPFVDTPESVILRLLKSYQSPLSDDTAATFTLMGTAFEPDKPPSLTFAKLRTARVGETLLERPTWAELLRHMHAIGLQKMGFDELKRISSANIAKGSRSDAGYSYIPDLGISLQGEDAQDCWSIALSLARHLRLPLFVEFEWRNNVEAERPGQVGSMNWEPKHR